MIKAKNRHFALLDKEWGLLVDPSTGLARKGLVEKVRCPVCGAVKHEKIFLKKGLWFVRCPRCGHLFINPQPKDAVLSKHFRTSEAWNVWSKEVLTSKKQSAFDRQKYGRAISEMLSCMPKRRPVKLLDVGCSSGAFLNLAREAGMNVSGVEPSYESANFARKTFGLDVFHGFFSDFKPSEKFDVITFWASLEYHKGVRRAVAKADSMLNDGGILFFLISGSSHSLAMRLLRDKCAGFLFNRVNYFNPGSLDYLLGSFKYKLLKRYSMIPEMEAILKYIDYKDPYGQAAANGLLSKKDSVALEQLINRNYMGYKFVSIYRKQNG